MDVYMDEYMNVSEWIYGCMSCVYGLCLNVGAYSFIRPI